MCERSAPDVPQEVLSRLGQARSLLVITHARPDGDGLGSMAALVRAARSSGRAAQGLLSDKVPDRYLFLFSEGLPAPAARLDELASQADLIIILDTSAYAQLDGLEEGLRKFRDKVLVIDHHVPGEPIGPWGWQDESAAATGVMVGEIIEGLGWPLDTVTAEALATALTTDTGWMRFANTDPRAMRCLARWMEAGLRADNLYRKLYQTDRPQRLRLMTRMLDTLRLHCGDRLATMTIRHADFDATGARFDETENLVNEPMRLASVEVAVLVVENTDCVRVSLRSRQKVDVAAIARRFGGGGHRRAAGLRLKEDVDVLLNKLIAACSEALGE